MISDKMRRRLKRRGKNVAANADDDDDKVSVLSPPKLRRDNGINISSSFTREFAFSLEEKSAPVIDTDDFGGGTISTVTNDIAFRDKAFSCGFDKSEYAIMQQQQQSQLVSRKKDNKTFLQLQTDGQEPGVGCINFGINKSSKKTSASPMGVNEFDSPNNQFEWADFDSNAKGSKANKQGPSARLNLRRSSKKKDDDSFFYSESGAPSEATTTDTRLVGETITLGSSSSYLHSFDILDNRKGDKFTTEQINRPVDAYQLEMGRGSPIRQSSPSAKRRDSSNMYQTKDEVHKAAPPPPPQPIQAPHRRSKNPKEDAYDSSKSGCTVPDIVQEMVDDVKSVLSQVISVAYLACTEGEQCLSKCQGEEPTPQPSQLDTIEEGFSAPVQDSSSSFVRRTDESKHSYKPWTGNYLCSRTGTEETADNSSQAEAHGTEKKQEQGPRTNRLRKFLTSFKSRR